MSFQVEPIPYWPVFVYGTLRPGQENYALLRGFTVAEEPAYAAHLDLFALPSYPMALSGSGTVVGDLLFLAPAIYRRLLQHLDDLEGWVPNQIGCQFRRVPCRVTTQARLRQPAWMYIGNRPHLGAEAVRIDHGDWVRYRRQQASYEQASLRLRDGNYTNRLTR
jgi:gamma-glutamylcyclotransferase (GGCT)/AIG2-like uncharacterized protein YtfP